MWFFFSRAYEHGCRFFLSFFQCANHCCVLLYAAIASVLFIALSFFVRLTFSLFCAYCCEYWSNLHFATNHLKFSFSLLCSVFLDIKNSYQPLKLKLHFAVFFSFSKFVKTKKEGTHKIMTSHTWRCENESQFRLSKARTRKKSLRFSDTFDFIRFSACEQFHILASAPL